MGAKIGEKGLHRHDSYLKIRMFAQRDKEALIFNVAYSPCPTLRSVKRS